ncbi:MAG: hypothetical protein L0332_21805 [Chloroflexi bacterium]|nr:hypothetical protein [Chloroflexota bacterium]MCI0581228.1 hypothetical protein [Chloroflexota bacterium]MCI0649592.1 hypothetical protein [Chloroflexota bacterium]MCI0729332.1 hypothetical protein [Chloroflexota bacterium]
MQNFLRTNRALTAVITFLLWLATAALALWEIVVIRDMFFRLYARFVGGEAAGFQPTYWAGTALGIGLVMFLAVVWIAVVIGGAEYHYRHAGQPGSWKVFAWTFAAEVSILLLALFI